MKKLLLLGLLSLVLAAAWAVSQQPQVTDTHFASEPASSRLSATVDRFLQSKQSLWLGYETSVLSGTGIHSCASSPGSSQLEDGCCGEIHLEQVDNNLHTDFLGSPAAANAHVLLRFEHGRVVRILTVAIGCRLNAGGVPFHWLTDVQPDDSVSFLENLAVEGSRSGSELSDVAEQALAAMSLHATSKATNALTAFTAPGTTPELREKAAFWLGAQRRHGGFVVLQRLVRQEQTAEFREKLAFDLFVNTDPGVTDELLRLAKSDSAAEVRGQALFWLAQKAGSKAAAALNNAIDKDPELAVKKKALFGLSQLPKDESIPQLIRVANSSPNPEIRKEAVFWLGQSNDPRALQFLEDLLKR